MATVKYRLHTKANPAPIYCRFTVSRETNIERKTGRTIDPGKWSKAKGLPLSKTPEQKNLNTELKKLEQYIHDQYNEAYTNSMQVNGDWLSAVIDRFYGRTEPEQLEYLTTYADKFLANLPQRETRNGKRVTTSTIKKYRSICSKLKSFEQHTGKRYLLTEVDLKFRTDFLKYLREVDGLSENTVGRYIKFVRPIVKDAEREGLPINSQVYQYKGFTEKVPKVVLSHKELEHINGIEFPNDTLNITKDWLMIGCYTGQRVSDLLRMNRKMVCTINGHQYIRIDQQKTGKEVLIPTHPIVREVLDKRGGEFPPSFGKSMSSASALFNRHLKNVCRIAGIDTLTEGNQHDPETGKYVQGKFPKWQLASTHICRRSFATNFYADRKYPTPLLMNITGHGTEKMFLEYIVNKSNDLSEQFAETLAAEVSTGQRNAKLKVV